jgi:hypothetical protein
MRSLLTRYNPLLFVALAMALGYHGALLLSDTYTHTYDAFVHIFLADHTTRGPGSTTGTRAGTPASRSPATRPARSS